MCYSLKIVNYGWEKRRLFVDVTASAYHVISKEVENRILRPNLIFRHTCMYKQPILTKQWNYNIFVQILYSYLRYIDRLLDVFFLLLAVTLSKLHEKSRRKDWVTEESKWRNLCEEHHFFGCTPSSLCHFLSFFFFIYSHPLPKWWTCWKTLIKMHNMHNKIDRVMSAIENSCLTRV